MTRWTFLTAESIARVSLILIATVPIVRGVYFTESSHSVVIASSLTVGDEATVVYVHSTPSVAHPGPVGAAIDCALEHVARTHAGPGGGGNGGGGGGGGGRETMKAHDWPFHVVVAPAESTSTVRILAALPLDAELRSGNATSFRLQISCTDRNDSSVVRSNVTVDVIRSDEWRHVTRQAASPCHRDADFQLAENVKNVVLGRLRCSTRDVCWQNSTADNCVLTVQGISNNKIYSGYIVFEESGLLTVEKSFDREEVDQLTIAYQCSSPPSSSPPSSSSSSLVLSSGGRSPTRRVCRATLSILDTDDQGPWFVRRDEGPIKYHETMTRLDELKTTMLKTIAIKDKDLFATNHYTAHLENDYNGLFSVRHPKRIIGLSNFFNTEVYIHGNPDRYTGDDASAFDVVVHIVDVSFIPSFNNNDNNTATYRINVQLGPLWKPVVRHPDSPNVLISSSASLYARLYYLGMNSTPYQIETIADDVYSDVSGVFAVTSREGIVYVNDTRLLQELINQTTVVVVKNCTPSSSSSSSSSSDPEYAECHFFLNITVNVEDSTTATGHYNYSPRPSCSAFYLESSCERTLGLGSPNGLCVWRKKQKKKTEEEKEEKETEDSLNQYETCSPSLVTCPDSHCDELEMSVVGLCPQDCTTYSPDGIGWSELNHRFAPPRGISKGQGPCWCEGSRCSCGRISGNFSQNKNLQPTMSSPAEVERCGATCRMLLLAGLSSFLVLSLVVVVWKYVYYRRKITRMKGHGSGIVPSDYVVTPGSVTTEYTDYTTGHLLDMNHQNFLDFQTDPKWEFNRSYIKFENVLGEGEFGKVVKAHAWEIQGVAGYTTVAVKMLRECASGFEYRDLLSELNLLKQINHRNVIKLLGVCSRKGPLYVIVEFCQHGSLRSFLRRVRRKKDYLEAAHQLPSAASTVVVDGRKLSVSSGGAKDPAPEDSVSVQDLLSFSWQIATGMDYLSGMKVVHRDLAARNILLASGRVIKISDFGLSRDVYEGDAYLKTSKGPLPVKWMAPESLYDHIYTTKSDVWSYGVVLWETYTLGANPYSGTPAERLYQLLKTGYRMTKPATCSEELFSVMLHCWADDPEKRPDFKELTEIFEQFLSLDKNYLDLNAFENVLPDDHRTPATLDISQGSVEEDEDEAARPVPDRPQLANGHYQTPRTVMGRHVDNNNKDVQSKNNSAGSNEISLGPNPTTTEGDNGPTVPLQRAKNEDQTGQTWTREEYNDDDDGGGGEDLEERGRGKRLAKDEESNALLAFSAVSY